MDTKLRAWARGLAAAAALGVAVVAFGAGASTASASSGSTATIQPVVSTTQSALAQDEWVWT